MNQAREFSIETEVDWAPEKLPALPWYQRIRHAWHIFFLVRDLKRSEKDWNEGRREKFRPIEELFN